MEHIMRHNGDDKKFLWDLDFLHNSSSATSPRNWFGPFNEKQANFVLDAIKKAERRFRKKGSVVKGIRVLRCGQPIAPKQDEDIDVCVSQGDDGPSAYHAPIGVIVTCPVFWKRAGNKDKSTTERSNTSAHTLVHEIFHWLSVDGKFVVDRHADGAGGLPDGLYYGRDNSMKLAKEKPSWAIVNNSNYQYFIHDVGTVEPFYAGTWTRRTGPGTGAFFLDMTWESLLDKRSELSNNQYLVDLETYVVDGTRRYIGVWQVGAGSGAIAQSDWDTFINIFKDLRSTQNLLDVEVIKSGNTHKLLGVYRKKQQESGLSGFLVDLTWNQLVEKWKEFSSSAHLVDVETYVKNGKRRYMGVWHPGRGDGGLLKTTDWPLFAKTKRDFNPSKDLVDFEQFLTGDGKWNFLGVWHEGRPSGQLHIEFPRKKFTDKWATMREHFNFIDAETHYPLPLRFPLSQ